MSDTQRQLEAREAAAARFAKRAEHGAAVIGGLAGAFAGGLAAASQARQTQSAHRSTLACIINGALTGAERGAERVAERGRTAATAIAASERFDDVLRLFQPSAAAERRRLTTPVGMSDSVRTQERREARRARAVGFILEQLERARTVAAAGTLQPAPATTIAGLQVSTYAPQLGEEEDCCICLDTLRAGDEIKRLPCGHSGFHLKCIEEWLGQGAAVCPMCRHEVL